MSASLARVAAKVTLASSIDRWSKVTCWLTNNPRRSLVFWSSVSNNSARL